MLVGDRKTNSIALLHAPTGRIEKRFQLTTAPGSVALDKMRGLLYVAAAPATFVVRLDVASGDQTRIPVPGGSLEVAVANGGAVFASLSPWQMSFHGTLALIDGLTGTVRATFDEVTDPLLAYDRGGDQLITGSRGSSAASLTRYAFDADNATLTQTQYRWDAGENGQDLTLSPDGQHIAYSCGGGNIDSYDIADFSSADLDTVFGAWETGAYPNAAAFSPDGRHLAALNFDQLLIFDTARHTIEQTFELDDPGFGIVHPVQVGFSAGGKFVFVLCEVSGDEPDSGLLFWTAFNP